MSDTYGQGPQKVTVSAGTAFKIGFMGALGATVFSLILSVVAGIVVLILVAVVGLNLGFPFGN